MKYFFFFILTYGPAKVPGPGVWDPWFNWLVTHPFKCVKTLFNFWLLLVMKHRTDTGKKTGTEQCFPSELNCKLNLFLTFCWSCKPWLDNSKRKFYLEEQIGSTVWKYPELPGSHAFHEMIPLVHISHYTVCLYVVRALVFKLQTSLQRCFLADYSWTKKKKKRISVHWCWWWVRTWKWKPRKTKMCGVGMW